MIVRLKYVYLENLATLDLIDKSYVSIFRSQTPHLI